MSGGEKWKTRTSDLVSIFGSKDSFPDQDTDCDRKLETISEYELLQNGDSHRVYFNDNVRNGRNGHREQEHNGANESKINTVRNNHANGGPGTNYCIKSMQEKSERLHLGDATTDSCFAGRRDILSPEHIEEHSIVSPKGTIRGYKNRVRAGIATFLEKPENDRNKKKNYKLSEKGKIVVYTTTVRIIRDTYDRCKIVKDIMHTHMIRYEERDVFMHRQFLTELGERLGCPSQVDVPQVFLDGTLLGDSHKLVELNETGRLRKMFRHFSHIDVKSSCNKCGGFRFMPCVVCHGSKKSLHRNNFTTEFVALKCMQCDENGLIRCDMCTEQQE